MSMDDRYFCLNVIIGMNEGLRGLRWEFIKENKNVRKKKEREHALDQESDQEND